MLSSSHCIASPGALPQLVGQGERISTSEKPLRSICAWNAFLIACLVLMMFAVLFSAVRAMNAEPLIVDLVRNKDIEFLNLVQKARHGAGSL